MSEPTKVQVQIELKIDGKLVMEKGRMCHKDYLPPGLGFPSEKVIEFINDSIEEKERKQEKALKISNTEFTYPNIGAK